MRQPKNRKNRPENHSELLTGKRPDADARLIRDILRADGKLDSDRDQPYSISAALPQAEVCTTRIETKLSQGTTTWASSSSSS